MSYTNLNYDYRRNRIIEPSQLYAGSDIFHPTADQKYMLGCILELANGDRFRYQEDDGTGRSKATMGQSSLPVSNWTEVANASGIAAVAGDTKLKVTLTTTRCYTDDFAEGWVIVMDTATPLGDMYLIKSNDVTGAGLTPILQIADAGGIREAIPITAELTICKNKFKDTTVVPKAAGSSCPTGVPLVDVTASYFFWAKTRGYAPLLVDGDDVVAGDPVGDTATAAVNGACGVITACESACIWGICAVENTSGETDQPAIIDLQLE